jgi:hypothetical protein
MMWRQAMRRCFLTSLNKQFLRLRFTHSPTPDNGAPAEPLCLNSLAPPPAFFLSLVSLLPCC